ncbi:hypothetical protein VCHA53O466_50319 [Vibrio chagasii]|nr:hypothetical protein VCHA53O466_50319 [Vibrio chagasii]
MSNTSQNEMKPLDEFLSRLQGKVKRLKQLQLLCIFIASFLIGGAMFTPYPNLFREPLILVPLVMTVVGFTIFSAKAESYSSIHAHLKSIVGESNATK